MQTLGAAMYCALVYGCMHVIAGAYQHVSWPGQVMHTVVAIIQLRAYSTQLVVLMAAVKGVVIFLQ